MRADKVLEKLGIDFELVEQDRPTKDCDDAARERGIETSQIVKSLIVETEDGFKHVCLPGDRKLSESKFGEAEDSPESSEAKNPKGFSTIRMASPEKSLELTNQESGTVHPFASELDHFFDERIFEHDRVSFTVGTTTEAVILDTSELLEAINHSEFKHEITDLCVVNDEDIELLKQNGATEAQSKFLNTKGYRKLFLELTDDYSPEMISKALEEIEREEVAFEKEDLEHILASAENDTHLQKIIEEFKETGEVNISDNGFDLKDVVSEILAANPEAVQDYQEGQDSAINYLLGQIMKETQGRADGDEARQKLVEGLK